MHHANTSASENTLFYLRHNQFYAMVVLQFIFPTADEVKFMLAFRCKIIFLRNVIGPDICFLLANAGTLVNVWTSHLLIPPLFDFCLLVFRYSDLNYVKHSPFHLPSESLSRTSLIGEALATFPLMFFPLHLSLLYQIKNIL